MTFLTMLRLFRPHWLAVRLRRASMNSSRFRLDGALRAELFSADQMEQYGAVLATQHAVTEIRRLDRLLPRLIDNEATLANACRLLTEAAASSVRATPAAEWLLDNYYLVEEQIRTAQVHLPAGFSQVLPKLVSGPSAGLPRVYDIALETISHADGRLDEETLARFVRAYQRVTVLGLGELWAIPIMLRLALIENLRRVAARVATDWTDRRLAAKWANRMAETAERDPKSIVLTVADMARSNPPMGSSFVAELARRLQGQSAALALPLNWIEQWLSESGLGIEHMIQTEAQQQAANQVSMRNSIGSLRVLDATDWRDFVERMSVVEGILREDPTGTYPLMDFATRDHYRHVVERLARQGEHDEPAVARAAQDRAMAAADDSVQAHVGYYLVGDGLPAFRLHLAIRATWLDRWQRLLAEAPLALYVGIVLLVTLCVAWPFYRAVLDAGWPGYARLGVALAALLAASRVAVGFTNWLVMRTVRVRVLPRLDFSAGIPAAASTMVVVPTLIGCVQDIDDLAGALEVRFLANRDPHLHFALLTDFPDAADAVMPGDDALLNHACQRIAELNAAYPADDDRFFLFHRPRLWNAAERTWMGYERKRGKLSQFNALLRGRGADAFLRTAGHVDGLPSIRYVITLDTDTLLPRDTAAQLLGAMEHPLNRPRRRPGNDRIVSGYGILQPRIGISLTSVARSGYASLFGGDAGVDPYTRAVSDVYQDLFDEGSFIGKGIYSVDDFEATVDGQFADNRVLSHDLLEGCMARSGLLSDVQLYEHYPSRYSDDARRRHRWIRGDWQLLPWLMPRTRRASGVLARNPLTALSRWKILDNLRRSLVPIAVVALCIVGWFAGRHPAWWTVGVFAIVLVPPCLGAALSIASRRDQDIRRHLATNLHAAGEHFARAALWLAWLPHEAAYSADAILRTLWRMFISRRRLLEWRTSQDVDRSGDHHGLLGVYRLMWMNPALALATMSLLAGRPQALPWACPLLLAWLVSPWLAWRMGNAMRAGAAAPTLAQARMLQRMARRTWAFFDDHMVAGDHFLPPDNIQELPMPVTAHRTSPTNLGLGLLAQLTAHDLGHISTGRLLEGLQRSLGTMAKMERHRGHFLNWYDTETLAPLLPQYVSTVDSGNLAGHLLTLRPGLVALADRALVGAMEFAGLAATLDVLDETWHGAADGSDALQPVRDALAVSPPAPASLAVALHALRSIEAAIMALSIPDHPSVPADAHYWHACLLRQCRDLTEDLAPFLLPASDGAEWMPSLAGLASLDGADWPMAARVQVDAVRQRARARLDLAASLASDAGAMALMDFGFLYDAGRDLFAIGYNVDERRLDAGFYDLLASEARLTHYITIAQGQVPQKSWFTLGRLLTTSGGKPVLLSWSGSMFEYLMPMLVMPGFPGTLLDETCRAAVARQIDYGRQLGVPWGVSESAYNVRDAHFNYQYRAFGVPGLGLKRGLGGDVVVAPYASALALMVDPAAACRNLQRLHDEGALGRYGLYEAIDYTPSRLPHGQSSVLVRSFMAHHQGMSLLSIASVLLGQPMQRRFSADPMLHATELLLQERVPRSAMQYLHAVDSPGMDAAARDAETTLRVFTHPDRARPAVQLLSNGNYHVMLSHAGGGYSRWRDLAITRWREDVTADGWGMFCYLREVATGQFWSAAYQPTLRSPNTCEAIFSDTRVEYRVREFDIDSHTEIVVSPEDDVELRRMHLTNRARTRRSIEWTTYAEVVLAPPSADMAHPAFSNLFVQTEIIESLQAIVCTRRARSATEVVPWMCHLVATHGADVDVISYETDRARFVGRGRDLRHPQAMDAGHGDGSLSNTDGSVLDPMVAIRCRVTLDPGQTAVVDIVTGAAGSRDQCLQLIGKFRDRHLADRVFDLAWTHGQVLLRQLNASPSDARMFEQMASSMIYASASLRADSRLLAANRRNQGGLWGQGISGDLPIVLCQVSESANIEMVRQLVQAHAYWRHKGLETDLVIWNEDNAGYRQQLQDAIMGLVASGVEASLIDRPGGIFVRQTQQMSHEDRILMKSVARIVVSDSRGSLHDQVNRRRTRITFPAFEGIEARDGSPSPIAIVPLPPPAPLLLANPYGGFSVDGKEYVIRTTRDTPTPTPWVNVLANASFGTVVSETGSAYTWAENAHEYRLTPWANDAVRDPCTEAIYLRDDESGQFWSPSPAPCPDDGEYTTRHGFGYSVFEHRHDGIDTELWVYVAVDAPVKFSVLKITNRSGRPRSLSVTGYVQWVLGDIPARSAMHVVTEADPLTGALFARNAYSMEFPDRVAFLDVDVEARQVTGDRAEFLGRNGTMSNPQAMRLAGLSGRVGAGLDPCGAMQVRVELSANETGEVIFRLGAGLDAMDAAAHVQRFRGSGAAVLALDALHQYWAWTLDKIRIATPSPEVDVLANGWLMYQVISSRFWARSGFYQSGGAYGFRDQLQDAMAMVHTSPFAVRQHLLLCASRQFVEGDVQHWWHPPGGRGVRTACSDDFLWLAVATERYVRITGDTGVLEDVVAYIDGRARHAGEESYYDLPTASLQREPLYRHCVRAIEHGLTQGSHGLPLIGSGDWNDGMNRVGEEGRGESIWLGFFLHDVLLRFAPLALRQGDEGFAARCTSEAARLREALESHGWDGEWYRRAYFDNGTALGSAANAECRIDSLAQSWSVLSGAAPDDRRRQAMKSLDAHLVQRDVGLVQLLDPPFDTSEVDPGYIKGYVPGVRENGGQYTHAAVWAAMAFAELRDGDRAWEIMQMINPVKHGIDGPSIERYKVEPYVMAADVYAVHPHEGRGGWSWYTGAAGWMYRLVTESLLGLRVEGDQLSLDVLMPADWPGFSLNYRYGETHYHIDVAYSPNAVTQCIVDGIASPSLTMIDDGIDRHVQWLVGADRVTPS